MTDYKVKAKHKNGTQKTTLIKENWKPEAQAKGEQKIAKENNWKKENIQTEKTQVEAI